MAAIVGTAAVVAPNASATPTESLPAAAQGHAYRHGVVPRRGQQLSQAGALPAPVRNLSFGGGTGGVGVTTGSPRVYLVFWGSQWGTQGTDSAGDVTLSGDPKGMAPYLQKFMNGLGTGGETWSGVMTQYCQGISTGTQTCPSSNGQHVGYPTGGALAGVWVDESAASPSQSTGHQLAQEAINAATHFGDFSSSSQYVIVSPTGTNPDNYESPTTGFCAWHDYTGDSTLDGGGAGTSPQGPVAFTNLPYVTDAGTSCGENFVNSGTAGTLDGVSIVEGHEYAETITDTFPAGGWTDSSGNENGDKCAWISSGQGASQDIALTTGTFAVQTTWANDASGCEVSHPVVSDPSGNTVTVSSPASQTSTDEAPITSLQMTAQDSQSGQTFTWSATGLPAGLAIDSSSGVISGTPTTVGSNSVTVTATDATNARGSASFTWTISKRLTSTSVSCAPSTVSIGVQTTCMATVTDTDTGTIGTPTGSVTFTPAGGCTLTGTGTTGVASCQASYTPGTSGAQTVTANYGGDGTHKTSTSSGFGLTVSKRSTSTSLACSPATLHAGNPTTCTATTTDSDSGTAATPTGTVNFSAAPTGGGSFTGAASCTLTGTGTPGVASCQTTYTPSTGGSPTITAGYQGDSTHAASTSTGFGLTVADNTVSVTSPGDQTTTSGTTASLAISGSNSGGLPLSYIATGLPAGLSINASTGVISGTPTAPGSPSVTITATDSTNASGSTTFTWTITTRSTSTSISCAPSTVATGSATTCTATVSDSDSGTRSSPSGTVAFIPSGTCNLAPSAPGVATCQTSFTPTAAGTQTITAGYSGDGTHTASNSSGFGVTVTSPSGTSGGSSAPTPSATSGSSSPSPAPASSSPLNPAPQCPAATGKLSGSTLGLIRLGMTRAQARGAYHGTSVNSGRYQDFFCLTPAGVRVGYASAKLLSGVGRAERGKLSGRVVWATTANTHYSAAGLRPGAKVAGTRGALSPAKLFRIGAVSWYLLPAKGATILIELKAGVVSEIGIAQTQLVRSAKTERLLAHSLS